MTNEVNSSNESGFSTINQGNEEKIVVSHVNVRQSIVFLISKLIVLDIIATLTALIFFSPLLVPLSMEVKLQIVSYNIWYFGLLIFAKILLTLFVVLAWLNDYYEISPTKIFHRRGIIWRKEDSYDLSLKSNKITTIGIQQGLIGRSFNYGTLFFYDRAVYRYYYMHYIHNPLRYLEILHHLLPNADVEKELIREHIRDKKME